MKPSNAPEILTMRETVRCFIEILLENLVRISADNDGIEIGILEEGLMFWISFVIDPPPQQADERISLLVGDAESIIRKLCLGDDNYIPERRKILLKEFLEKINEAKGQVRQLQIEIRGLLENNNAVPGTNRMGFLDFLVGNLKKFREEEVQGRSKNVPFRETSN